MVEERQRIARDLHDSVSQSLFSLTLEAQVLALMHENPRAGRPERVRAGLAEMRAVAQSTLSEMRLLVEHLRPAEVNTRASSAPCAGSQVPSRSGTRCAST